MMVGNGTSHNIDIHLNLFDKNFGKKMKNVTNNLNKNMSQIQNTSKNFGISTESLERYQNMFNLSLTKTGNSLLDVNKKQIRNADSLNKYVGEYAGFGQVMRMNQEQFRKFNESGVKFNKTGGRMANWLRKSTHGMRGFRMEMLGVMFFGMALQRTFNGLIKTSLEWTGVNEVLTTTLGLLFLPVAELLLNWALMFLEWVGNLTEDQKKLIGMFVLLGIAFGTVLLVIGTLALGIGSLIMAFGWLLSPLGLVLGAFLALAGYTIFKSMFDDTSGALSKLREKVVAFGISGEAFDSVANKIKSWYQKVKKYLFGNQETGSIGLINEIKDKISGSIDENKESFIFAGKKIMGNIIEGAKQFFTENPLVLVGAIVGGLTTGPIGAGIGAAIGLGLGKIDMEKMDEVIEKGIEILNGIINGLVDNIDTISTFLSKLFEAMTIWINEHIDEIIEIGVKIGTGIVKGIIKGFKGSQNEHSWLYNLLNTVSLGSLRNVGILSNVGSDLLDVSDAIISPNGNIISTNPRDYLIATKNPGELGGGSIVISPTYYVTVSDKREFQTMLEKNNRQLLSETRRIVKI